VEIKPLHVDFDFDSETFFVLGWALSPIVLDPECYPGSEFFPFQIPDPGSATLALTFGTSSNFWYDLDWKLPASGSGHFDAVLGILSNMGRIQSNMGRILPKMSQFLSIMSRFLYNMDRINSAY
jgi:hypothetical protein